jgi:hypothetical protein
MEIEEAFSGIRSVIKYIALHFFEYCYVFLISLTIYDATNYMIYENLIEIITTRLLHDIIYYYF